ncbi:MAG TPA: asparagine synthase (glutamine-hydrolyzing) [Solibacterales bacterium]|nr:asparagine synthase (glutamine-hydrolyzing) [Bryobacterales bacterium]
MCGIAGIFSPSRPADGADVSLVRAMLDIQRHRGPDGAGVESLPRAVLGHRRLSIIDLSEAGRQPMSNAEGDVWLSFNGEIYNYLELRRELAAAGRVFRSGTDSEVLIHGYQEWGIDGLCARLRGMYAFALCDDRPDRQEGEVFFLVRDRLGIKPVYLARRPDGAVMFASEVKALIAAGADGSVDPTALVGFLCLGSVPHPRTWARGVECLPPAQILGFDRAGRERARRYWTVSFEGPEPSREEMAAELETAVRQHLLSDVPLGIFLSGGVDSAGVVAMARRSAAAPLVTLTVSFDENEFNEGEAARRLAAHFGTDHREVRVRAGDFLDEIHAVLGAMDQPTADGVNTYFVSRAAREAGLTVVLSGLGGDEVFFGYPHYRPLASGSGPLHTLAGRSPAVRRLVSAGAGAWGSLRGEERWRRFAYLQGRPLNDGLYLLFRGFFAPQQVRGLLDLTEPEFRTALDEAFPPGAAGNGHVDATLFQRHELARYLHDQLLRDSDVFSMAHSLELRVPYLDHEVIGLANRIPPARKLAETMNKPRLVEAIGDPLVEEAARHPKRGFTFPFKHWLSSHSAALEREALAAGPLRPDAVSKLWSGFRRGRLHWSRAWATAVVAAKSAAS